MPEDGIKANLKKSFVWWDEFQGKMCFLTLPIRRGYTFELCLDEIIIYDNFQNLGKRKRPDKLSSPIIFKNYNPGASLIVAVSIQTNFSNAPFAPVKISCVTSSPSSPATLIPFA